MRTAYGIIGTALLAGASCASAAIIPTTVTASGTYQGNLAVLNDGVFPPNSTPYNTAASVHDYSSATSFTFAFGGSYTVNQLSINVDFNDDYTFTFLNGATTVGSYTYLAGSGPTSFGLQNVTASISPLTATSVRLTTSGGDGLYGVGEAQFNSATVSPSGVPEPATWAMMIVGFGATGAVCRQRRRAVGLARA